MWKKSKIFTTNMYLRHHSVKGGLPDYHRTPRAVCEDGFTFSVQASGGHYGDNRLVRGMGFLPVNTVEVMFERPYPLGVDVDDCGIAAWLPVRELDSIISEHGGIRI